jgi:hypothetical protein
MKTLILAVLCVVGSTAPAWADLSSARATYARADHPTAFKEYLALAKQGQAEAQLTPAELSRAQELARSWPPTKTK